MNKTKIFEWLGWLMVMASIWANGVIRNNGNSDSIWLNITVALMAIGATITFVTYFIRKKQDSSKKE